MGGVEAGDLDCLFGLLDPAIEWDLTHFEWPESNQYHGHDGVRRFFEEWLASWERYESGAESYRSADRDRVLVFCWQRAFGPDSHAPVEMDWAQIFTVTGPLIPPCREPPTGNTPSKPPGSQE